MVRVSAHPELATRLVYSALYRYDDSLAPVPDLAAEPCAIGDDGVTITCELVDATFHDGSPLTADDVAFTYELGRRSDCAFAFGYCFDEMLESATAIDERTVRFTLSRPDATFLTLIMPDVLIDSREVVEAAYAELAERAPNLHAVDYESAAGAILDELGADEPDCEEPLPEAEELLTAAGVEPLPREQFHRVDGTFDACMYAEVTGVLLEAIGASLQATGLDAIALAYRALSFNREPIGTGPFRWAGMVDPARARLEAYSGYHRGPPAAPAIEIAVMRDLEAAKQALLAGDVHWLPIPTLFPEIYEELRTEPDLRFVQFPDPTYYMLAYNLREGMLLSDLDLRAALELCVDKPATVDAATDGTGDPIYSFVAPVSWAFHADLPRPARDVDEARALIEGAGWTEADDGIYVRDGERLATDVFVTAEDTQRVRFVQLIAEQARDCGFDLTVVPADTQTVLSPLAEYPHIPGGRVEPFEAHFLGWLQGYDPHEMLWHSSSVTSEEQPGTVNFMGYASDRADALLDAGLATYDQRERAQIYRELQEVIAEEKPVLFAWAVRAYDAIDARLGYVDDEIDLGSPQWFWQPEKLVLRGED
jgi:ABC-type transport system substrate-binding protein